MSVAPAPGTCCRQSWGKALLATRPGAWAALERGQLKQPRLDLPWVREERRVQLQSTARAKAPARVAVVVVLLVERLEMLTQLHVQLMVVVLVVLLVELLVEPLEMLVQLHVQLKVLVLVVLLPRAAGNAGAPEASSGSTTPTGRRPWR